MSPASSPMSHRRAGTIPWVPWRPLYAILSNAHGSRRPAAKEAAPLVASKQSNLLSPSPSTFLRYGAPHAGRCKKTHVTAVAARSLYRSRRRCRRAPHLVSCPSRTKVGSREFPAPTTRRWGASSIFREQARLHRTRTSRPMPTGVIFHNIYSTW